MDDLLVLPLSYQGKGNGIRGAGLSAGLHSSCGSVGGDIAVQFELDDEQNYRALVSMADLDRSKKLSVRLLEAIAFQLESIRPKS